MKEEHAKSQIQPPAHSRVTVRRVLPEDDAPFMPDEIDAMIFRASVLARLRPA